MADQQLTPHFSVREMSCRCCRPDCDAKPMRRSFMAKLERLRVEWGKPLKPTSAARCRYWNNYRGGALFSQHLEGNAADFVFEAPAERDAFAALAEKFGFGGIGVGCWLVHIDDREHPARWTYSDR